MRKNGAGGVSQCLTQAPFIFATHWIKKVTLVADIFDPLFDPPFLKRL